MLDSRQQAMQTAAVAWGPYDNTSLHPDDNSASQSPIGIALTVAEPGVYTFVVGLWQDRTGPAARAEVSERFDPNAAHEWSGQACTAADMQAQLPSTTNPPTPLLCPGPSPALTYS
jgi:hypothetical protein